MQKKVLRNANRTISSFNCKMFSVIIWIYKSFTFHLFGNGRLLRRLIWIHLYTHKFFYHFCTNFHNTRLSTLAILDKLPSILFPCKNHPTPCSYMFHQSCAFCFVLILPLAPSGKYLYITSLKLWLFFLVPGPGFHFKDQPHWYIFPFINSSILSSLLITIWYKEFSSDWMLFRPWKPFISTEGALDIPTTYDN